MQLIEIRTKTVIITDDDLYIVLYILYSIEGSEQSIMTIVPMNPRTDVCLESDISSVIPQWWTPLPTRELIKRGLTTEQLEKEVRELNAASINNTGRVPPTWIVQSFWFLGLMLLVVAMCASGASRKIWVLSLFWFYWILACISFSISFLMMYFRNSAIEIGFDVTKVEIEKALNDKYKSKGIRWIVADGVRRNGGIFGNRLALVRHIIVACINTDNIV